MQGSFRWDDLGLLAALVRAGTISGAADRLGVNASTVSRRLEAFEEHLGVHLFDRMPDGVAPTEIAEQIFPLSEIVEQAAAEVWRLVEGQESELEGLVRVTAPPGVASQFVAPLLARFYAHHPKVRVQLDASVGYADLTRREADIALRLTRPRHGDLVSLCLGVSSSAVHVCASLAKSVGTLRDLNQLSWIDWGPDLEHLPDSVWLRKHVEADRIVLRTSSIDSQLAAALAGVGAVVMPSANAQLSGLVELPLAPALRRRLPALPQGALWLVGHRALRHVPRISAVWDFLREQAAQLDALDDIP